MNTYEVFKLYHALKLHFKSSYDYFKYRGKINVTLETFNTRKDRFMFGKIRHEVREEDLLNLFVSALLNNPDMWVGDIFSPEVTSYHTQRIGRLESLTYHFKETMVDVMEEVSNPKELLVTSGDYPILLEMLMGGKVSLEVVCILNGILNFLPFWGRMIKDTIAWPAYQNKVIKYSPFLSYDLEGFTKLLTQIINPNR